MAPDERDRIFDKALARHLRADGSSPSTANAPFREFVRVGECPGPETLAAYHERSLLPEEMNSWKEHIVGCANCQTVLSHLEATDEIPLQAAEEEKVLAQRETVIQTSASGQSQPAAPRTLSARAGNGSLPRVPSPPACWSGSRCTKSSRCLVQVWTIFRSRPRKRHLLQHRRFRTGCERPLRL